MKHSRRSCIRLYSGGILLIVQPLPKAVDIIHFYYKVWRQNKVRRPTWPPGIFDYHIATHHNVAAHDTPIPSKEYFQKLQINKSSQAMKGSGYENGEEPEEGGYDSG